MDKPITLTPNNLIIGLSVVALAWLLVQVETIIILLFVSLLLALVLEPAVIWQTKRKVPRSIAVILTMLSIVLVVGGLLTFSLTPIVNQTTQFISQFPKLLKSVVGSVSIDTAISNIGNAVVSQVASTSDSIIKITLAGFEAVLTAMSVLFFTAYILIDMENLRRLFLGLFKREDQNKMVAGVLEEIQLRLGGWLRGQIVLMLVIGIGTYVGLSLLRLDYVLPLAIIAGFLEIVPILGPILSAVPSVVVGFAVSPLVGLGVLGWFILLQQLENNLIVPKVMQKSVGFNPLITMVVILIGAKLLGMAGALLAVPITLVVAIIIKNILPAGGAK